MSNNPQQMMNVDISQTTEIFCGKCKNPIFVKALRLRKLSALMSPNGQEAVIPMETLVCGSCGKEWNEEQENQPEKNDGNKNNDSPKK
tara:strand:- start:85 stop:348 length:264 start_codon:yes stop_codon:yes gene_type:complete